MPRGHYDRTRARRANGRKQRKKIADAFSITTELVEVGHKLRDAGLFLAATEINKVVKKIGAEVAGSASRKKESAS